MELRGAYKHRREMGDVARVEWVVSVASALLLGGCGGGGGGGTTTINVPEGSVSPDQAVEVFMQSAQQAVNFRAVGELAAADKAYDRMAGVFGTENGSISRSFPAQEVRDRMIVIAACLRPDAYRRLSQLDPDAQRVGSTTVSVELIRGTQKTMLPFKLVLGRGDRWFVTQVDFSTFTC